MMGRFPMNDTTGLTFLNLGDPTGLKFVIEHGATRLLFAMGIEHAPGAMPFSLGLEPPPGRQPQVNQAGGEGPRGGGGRRARARRTRPSPWPAPPRPRAPG